MMATAPAELSTAPRIGPRLEAERFLFTLFADPPLKGEWFELRCLDCSKDPTMPGPRLFFRSLSQLIDRAMILRRGFDVFIGVGYRRCPDHDDIHKCRHETKGEDHISRLPAVWADLDVISPDEPNKPYTSVVDALDALYALDKPPALIVGSGAGLHAYWPLKHPSHDLARVVESNRRIRDQIKGDNAIDACRILRLPGTFNRKLGRPMPVTLIEGPVE